YSLTARILSAAIMGPRVGARVAESSGGRLLSTKLTRPSPRSDRVIRRRLIARLDAGLTRPLILVAAPAGFGKTTILADWLDQATAGSHAIAWLGLDESDDDPARFWSYVVGALESALPGVASGSAALLRVPDVGILQNLVQELARELAMVTRPLVLVLD